MLLKRVFTGGRKRDKKRQSPSNSDPAQVAQPPVFEERHHDLLIPAPLMPPYLAMSVQDGEEEGSDDVRPTTPLTVHGELGDNGQSLRSSFVVPTQLLNLEDTDDSSALFPDGLLPDNHGDSVVQLSLDLQRPSPPAWNPAMARTSSRPTSSSSFLVNPSTDPSTLSNTRIVNLEDDESIPPRALTAVTGGTVLPSYIVKGFPPAPEQDIPIVTAAMIVEDDDDNVLNFQTARRANTFPPFFDPYATVSQSHNTEPNQYAANSHCIVIPSASRVEHVIVDDYDDSGYQSTTSLDRLRQHSSPLSLEIQKLLWKTKRLSRSVCKKTLRIAKEHVAKTKPTVQDLANRSLSFAKQTSQTIQHQMPVVKQQFQNTHKHLQRCSSKACQSIRDWDSRHQISHSVLHQTKQGWKFGCKVMVTGLHYRRVNAK